MVLLQVVADPSVYRGSTHCLHGRLITIHPSTCLGLAQDCSSRSSYLATGQSCCLLSGMYAFWKQRSGQANEPKEHRHAREIAYDCLFYCVVRLHQGLSESQGTAEQQNL